jgi:hypothetical protein
MKCILYNDVIKDIFLLSISHGSGGGVTFPSGRGELSRGCVSEDNSIEQQI